MSMVDNRSNESGVTSCVDDIYIHCCGQMLQLEITPNAQNIFDVFIHRRQIIGVSGSLGVLDMVCDYYVYNL